MISEDINFILLIGICIYMFYSDTTPVVVAPQHGATVNTNTAIANEMIGGIGGIGWV
jgi:hypothetical protein